MPDHDAPTDAAATGSAAGFSQLVAERLVIRAMRTDDAPVLAAYRNDSETARGPGLGNAIQCRRRGPLRGEAGGDGVAAQRRLGAARRRARRQDDRRHRGLPIQRRSAGTDRLYARASSSRPRASPPKQSVLSSTCSLPRACTVCGRRSTPRTLPPRAVLERLGFRFEGRSADAAHVRDEWCDDLRYALLVDERSEWLERPRHRPIMSFSSRSTGATAETSAAWRRTIRRNGSSPRFTSRSPTRSRPSSTKVAGGSCPGSGRSRPTAS